MVAPEDQEYYEYSLAAKVFVVAGIFIFISICIFTLIRTKGDVQHTKIELTTAQPSEPTSKVAEVVDQEKQIQIGKEATTFVG